jgi:hypothetical protein
VRRVPFHHGADVVRLVDAQDAAKSLVFADLRWQRHQLVTRIPPSRDFDQVRLQFLELFGTDEVR